MRRLRFDEVRRRRLWFSSYFFSYPPPLPTVIEKYTKHTRFCLICNYVSKIIPALQSRCTRFRFAPLSADQMKVQIMRVVQAEKCVS